MKPNFLKHTATYGLYIGLALIILTLIDYVAGLYGQNKIFSLLQYVVMIGGIVWATINYRNTEMGGFISYGQSLGYGVVLSVFFGVVSAVFTVILVTVIDPAYMEHAMDLLRENLLEEGKVSEDQIDAMMAMSEKFANPVFTFFTNIIGAVFMGLIITLITSIFTKKVQPFTPAE